MRLLQGQNEFLRLRKGRNVSYFRRECCSGHSLIALRSGQISAQPIAINGHPKCILIHMGTCCTSNCSLEPEHDRQKRTLRAVLLINAVMFVVIVGAGLYGRSTSLLADSLDNLGDALTYGLSLAAVGGSLAEKARVSIFKGGLILIGAIFVGSQIVFRIFNPVVPLFEMMSGFAALALLANSACLYLLWRHRDEDINMSSVWECSRNDIASNLAVIVAGIGVWAFGSGLPDLLVAGLLFIILVRSAFRVLASSISQLRVAAS